MRALTATRILRTLAEAEGGLTVAGIASRTGIDRKQTARSCGVLLHRALVARPRVGLYEITASGRELDRRGEAVRCGPQAPLTGPCKRPTETLRVRCWRALRQLQKATVPDLVQLAERGDERDGVGNARRYVNALVASGHVVVMARREPGTAPSSNGFKRYLLVRNTGPKAPVWRMRRGEVYDPNTGETHALEAAP